MRFCQLTHCPACRTSLIATRFWVVVICPIIKCLTVLEFSFILFDLCLFITIFNFILNYVPIVTFWIFTYHEIWILLIIVRRAGLLWSQQDFEWRWSVPLFKCLTVLEFSFILFDLCLLITFFNFIMNYVPIVTFWIFTYHKIWILLIIVNYVLFYMKLLNYLFFSMFGSVLESCELTGVCLLLPWLIKWK